MVMLPEISSTAAAVCSSEAAWVSPRRARSPAPRAICTASSFITTARLRTSEIMSSSSVVVSLNMSATGRKVLPAATLTLWVRLPSFTWPIPAMSSFMKIFRSVTSRAILMTEATLPLVSITAT